MSHYYQHSFHANHRRANNGIEVPLLVQWLMLVFMMGLVGLFFVYLKNQQHALGEQLRMVEQKTRELHAHEEALVAKITSLTSRGALQRRVEEHYVDLVPIPETAIARMNPIPIRGEQHTLQTAALTKKVMAQ
ncbi:MAG: hypothetical protein K2W99_01675 [Chthoniobacterales bacterium]|nr:hypothetical protein [Chthoniobacterales bacterium]